MAFEFGINVDPGHWAANLSEPAALIAGDGFHSSRCALVLGREAQYQAYEQELAARGIWPIRCLTGESFTADERADDLFQDRISWWNVQLGAVEGHWEVGNEPEPGGGNASWTMSKPRFGKLIAQARDALGSDDYLISGGLVSGQPQWLEGVPEITLCDAKAIHFYEMRPSLNWPSPNWGHGALDFPFEAMSAAFDDDGIPWVVTEFGGDIDWFPDGEDQRAEYFRRTLDRFRAAPFISSALVFCLDVVMHPKYGLRDDTDALAGYLACAALAKAIPKPPPGGAAVGQTLEEFIADNTAKLGRIWVPPSANVIKRAAVTDHHLLIEYVDENGETWVTPLKQDDSFFE